MALGATKTGRAARAPHRARQAAVGHGPGAAVAPALVSARPALSGSVSSVATGVDVFDKYYTYTYSTLT